MVTIAAKIGYLTSVTNPLALAVAQPLVGVPVFSGALFRATILAVFLPLGIWFLLRSASRRRIVSEQPPRFEAQRLAGRHVGVLLVLLASVVVMVVGVRNYEWGNAELSAMYILGRISISSPPKACFVTVMVSQLVLGVFASMIVAWFSRKREFRADAASAGLLGSPQPMVSAA